MHFMRRLFNSITVNKLVNQTYICHSLKSQIIIRNLSEMAFLEKLEAASKLLAPSLTSGANYKGQSGKIGIFGGSFEYTGAPYFAAISALKVGADLVHIFCAKDAAIPIKCYSPELIVHPMLELEEFENIKRWLKPMDVVLIGPGLGRNDKVLTLIEKIISFVKEIGKPLIIDADGLYLLSKKSSLLNDFNSTVILTPNRMELARLMKVENPDLVKNMDMSKFILDNGWNENIIILAKGQDDEIISTNMKITLSNLPGSGRRCGGQGDILAGSLAVFLHWAKHANVAIYSACKLVRFCNVNGFVKKGRSMTAGDMVDEIHTIFDKHFEVPN